MLVKEGTVLAHIGLAQSTKAMDWSRLDLVPFAKDTQEAKGLVCLPADNRLVEVTLTRKDGAWRVATDPLAGKVTFKVRMNSEP